VNLVCGSRTEREKAHRDTVRSGRRGRDGVQPWLRGVLADRLVVAEKRR
jgi:hypothetical protein